MPIWEYKVITSGKGGFATPALLEKYLNDLGREEWEIIDFHNQPDNFLAFTGLARRSTQRDWTLEGAAAAAAKAEADKLRAEFEAKFKAGTSVGGAPVEEGASFLEEKLAGEDGFRKLVDTSHDADADEEDKDDDDWDKLTAAEEEELPNFFEAIKPHMRRNQRGPGMSVGVDYLAKKWGQSEDDLKGALVECGFSVPEDEDAKPEYLEFEGDLFWVNINRRGELWINTKEKPRPVFRAVKAQKVVIEDAPKPERSGSKPERESRKPELMEPAIAPTESPVSPTPAAPTISEPEAGPAPVVLATGSELLDRIRPHMRRNRRGPGGSGSVNFLSRALKCRDADLVASFKTLGLVVPSSANEKPTNVEIGNEIWWINMDSRGGIWINGRDKKPGEVIGAPESSTAGEGAESSPDRKGGEGLAGPARESRASESPTIALEAVSASGSEPGGSANQSEEASPGSASERGPARESSDSGVAGSDSILENIRPLLKETRTGATAGKLERVADAAGKSVEDLVARLTTAGLVVPEKPREKAVFVESGGEIFWLNRNGRGEIWLNAKPSKFAHGDEKSESPESTEAEATSAGTAEGAEKKPRRPRLRKKAE